MLKYCVNNYKFQEMCEKALLPFWKLDWFLTNKMLKGLYNAVFFKSDMVFVNVDSHNETDFREDMGLVNVDLNPNLAWGWEVI